MSMKRFNDFVASGAINKLITGIDMFMQKY